MTEIDVATRHRQVTILQCMVAKDEDEIIWTLSMNKDIMKKELGFGKYLTSYIPCICISIVLQILCLIFYRVRKS